MYLLIFLGLIYLRLEYTREQHKFIYVICPSKEIYKIPNSLIYKYIRNEYNDDYYRVKKLPTKTHSTFNYKDFIVWNSINGNKQEYIKNINNNIKISKFSNRLIRSILY